MKNTQNYYEILGVPKTASVGEIKKRYRELVRLHHPDVAADKAGAQAAFIKIAEAYQTLVKPDKRMLYDSTLGMSDFKVETGGRSTSRTTDIPKPPTEAPRATRQARPEDIRRTRQSRVESWMVEARRGFSSGQFRSAIHACREAVNLEPRNAEAHILMGDIYRIQGSLDEALGMYTIAIQLDPRNAGLQAKLDRLIRRTGSHSHAAGGGGDANSLKSILLMVTAVIVCGLLAWLYMQPGQPVAWIQEHLLMIGLWTDRLITILAVNGLLLGFILSISGNLVAIEDELVFPSVRAMGLRRVSYPVGLLLVFFSLFSFYVAAILYVLIAWLQESMSKSVLMSLGVSFGLVALSSLAFPRGSSQVFYFGGNIIFPAFLLGWGIGDMFRPRW